MWNVNPPLDENYGPEFGVDYARFSDPPDMAKDFHLQTLIEKLLSINDQFKAITPTVRNGFIVLKGNVPDQKIRSDVTDFVRTIPGVVEVINQISVNEHH